jgi:hypothetical protein
MLSYACRALPWARLGVVGALVVALMEVVRRWPWEIWPLEGVAVGLLAAGAGWCFDEPAAAVVDTAPRRLAWRTAVRSSGLVLLLVAWVGAVFWSRDSLFGHPGAVAGQGIAMMIAAAAYATWRRSGGDPVPSRSIALTAVPTATFWALLKPWDESVAVFPYADAGSGLGSWNGSVALWSIVAGAALIVLVAALIDVRWSFRPDSTAPRGVTPNESVLPTANSGTPGSR